MSRMYPSSSHQLVAAAFRRARKKFPTNFGQFSWPVECSRRDSSKSEPISSMITMPVCKHCQDRRDCEIRNSRSNNVWPSFPNSWRCDPQGGSVRDDPSSLSGRNSQDEARRRASRVCPCKRRLCKSWKAKHCAVSFESSEQSHDKKASGDVERSSIETVSKTARPETTICRGTRIFRNEKRKELPGSKSRKVRRRRARTASDSCTRDDDSSEDSKKMGSLDLLYDRRLERARNTVTFSSSGRKKEENAEEALTLPCKIDQWEKRTHSFEPRLCGTNPSSEHQFFVKDRECVRKMMGQVRGGSTRQEIRRHREERDHLPEKSSESRSSSFNGRLCKDCALVESSRGSSRLLSLDESKRLGCEDEQPGDPCAIRHKDSMAILVEKFKNKRLMDPSDDETTIYKSDDENDSIRDSRTVIKEKSTQRYEPEHFSSQEDDEDEATRRKIHRNKSFGKSKFYKSSRHDLESRARSTGHCCSVKQV